MSTSTFRVIGLPAINFAHDMGLTLSKLADPTENALEGLTVYQAREIAADGDEDLVYIDVPAVDSDIRELAREAGAAGDQAMVTTCVAALAGAASQRRLCAKALFDMWSASVDS